MSCIINDASNVIFASANNVPAYRKLNNTLAQCNVMLTDRISVEGNPFASVRPSVRPSVRFFLLYVMGHTHAVGQTSMEGILEFFVL